MSVFEKLSSIDTSAHVEVVKSGTAQLKYLSWTHAWAGVCKAYPEATYEVVKQSNGLPYVYDDNTGYMVNTRVTIEGLTHEMWLFVMDGANKAMKSKQYSYWVKDWNESKRQNKEIKKEKHVEAASMFDINKTIMRCLVKNLAMFGYGINIYAGEDLPMTVKTVSKEDRESLVSKYGENIVIFVEQQNGAICDAPESQLQNIDQACHNAALDLWKSQLTLALKERMRVDKNFVQPHISHSLKKHLSGCLNVADCNDLGLLQAYHAYNTAKIDELNNNKEEK